MSQRRHGETDREDETMKWLAGWSIATGMAVASAAFAQAPASAPVASDLVMNYTWRID